MVTYTPANITASTTLRVSRHGDGGVVVNAAAGLTLTLPAASGKGGLFKIFIGTTVTSNNVVISPNGTDTMAGVVVGGGAACNGWATAAGNNTITLNGTTKGGIKGDYIELRDVASGVWSVRGFVTQTGTAATMFSTV